MGLEIVELVMALEESFGVELKDDELVKAVTPRMVDDLIFSQLKTTDEKTCQTQRAFYVLRRTFMRVLGLDRNIVTLDMNIREFIPRHKEEEIWPQLGVAVAARNWPKLVRPKWMTRSMAAGSFAVFCLTIYFLNSLSLGLALGFIIGVGVSGAFWLLFLRLALPFEKYIPERFKTVRDIIPPMLTSEHVKWTREQVSELVKKIVMEQLGISEAKYREDANFVKDFGLD